MAGEQGQEGLPTQCRNGFGGTRRREAPSSPAPQGRDETENNPGVQAKSWGRESRAASWLSVVTDVSQGRTHQPLSLPSAPAWAQYFMSTAENKGLLVLGSEMSRGRRRCHFDPREVGDRAVPSGARERGSRASSGQRIFHETQKGPKFLLRQLRGLSLLLRIVQRVTRAGPQGVLVERQGREEACSLGRDHTR